MSSHIKVIIPAYNEEDSIGKVIKDIPLSVNEIIVVSNNSTDDTEKNARAAGATVLTEESTTPTHTSPHTATGTYNE